MVALLVVVTPVLDLAGVARGNAGGGTACCPLQANPGLPVTVPITISAPVLGPVQSFVRLPRIPLLAVSIFIPPRA
jgi:hypothetical protein